VLERSWLAPLAEWKTGHDYSTDMTRSTDVLIPPLEHVGLFCAHLVQAAGSAAVCGANSMISCISAYWIALGATEQNTIAKKVSFLA